MVKTHNRRKERRKKARRPPTNDEAIRGTPVCPSPQCVSTISLRAVCDPTHFIFLHQQQYNHVWFWAVSHRNLWRWSVCNHSYGGWSNQEGRVSSDLGGTNIISSCLAWVSLFRSDLWEGIGNRVEIFMESERNHTMAWRGTARSRSGSLSGFRVRAIRSSKRVPRLGQQPHNYSSRGPTILETCPILSNTILRPLMPERLQPFPWRLVRSRREGEIWDWRAKMKKKRFLGWSAGRGIIEHTWR